MMGGNEKTIEVSVREHRLKVKKDFDVLKEYAIATGKYPEQPKYWAWDYRTPIGEYFIKNIHTKDSPGFSALNEKEYPWYLTNKARDAHEDAGPGVYGEGIISLNYPNRQDVARFRDSAGEVLKDMWYEFCEVHWRPIYEYISRKSGVLFDHASVNGDFGERTYRNLLESVPVSDVRVAFGVGVAIHGTNDPDCIGTNISGGCIRMHNHDIKELIEDHVTICTPVVIKY